MPKRLTIEFDDTACPIPGWAGDYIRIHFANLPSNTPGDDAIAT